MYDFKQVGLLGKVWAAVGPNITLPYSQKDVDEIKNFLKPLPPIGQIVKGMRLVLTASVVAYGCHAALGVPAVRATLVTLLKSAVSTLEDY